MRYPHTRRPGSSRSFIPEAAVFIQLAVVLFALLGVNQIILLGSEGVVKPNTLVNVTLPQVKGDPLWRFNDYCDYIVIGWPLDGSPEPRIQLADQFVSVEDIGPFVRAYQNRRCEVLRPKTTMVIYADARMPMEVITAVKQELRLAGQLRICYAVTP